MQNHQLVDRRKGKISLVSSIYKLSHMLQPSKAEGIVQNRTSMVRFTEWIVQYCTREENETKILLYPGKHTLNSGIHQQFQFNCLDSGVEGCLVEFIGGIARMLMSRGYKRYSMSSSLKILTISSTKRARLCHFSPISWWFILCLIHTQSLNLFKSSIFINTTDGDGYQ